MRSFFFVWHTFCILDDTMSMHLVENDKEYKKKYSSVKNEREVGVEGEGRAVWKLIGHLTGAVDSGVHRARR